MFYKTQEDYLMDLELASRHIFPRRFHNDNYEIDQTDKHFNLIQKGAEAIVLKDLLESTDMTMVERSIFSYFVLSGAIRVSKEISLFSLARIVGAKSIATIHKALNNLIDDYRIVKGNKTSRFNCCSYSASLFEEYVHLMALSNRKLKSTNIKDILDEIIEDYASPKMKK